MDAANCAVERHDDKRFLRKPLPGEALIWERICKQCPVSLQCMEWADEHGVTGVYAAGEWRE
ncbi:WhiB family transcriptional regulator [Mycobacterium intracellulare]|uniref:WhiB family transcriptional regulator n=1 Tax=Mycobacterium intracellulare TaxID=1767 RepID=UPI003B20F6CF